MTLATRQVDVLRARRKSERARVLTELKRAKQHLDVFQAELQNAKSCLKELERGQRRKSAGRIISADFLELEALAEQGDRERLKMWRSRIEELKQKIESQKTDVQSWTQAFASADKALRVLDEINERNVST